MYSSINFVRKRWRKKEEKKKEKKSARTRPENSADRARGLREAQLLDEGERGPGEHDPREIVLRAKPDKPRVRVPAGNDDLGRVAARDLKDDVARGRRLAGNVFVFDQHAEHNLGRRVAELEPLEEIRVLGRDRPGRDRRRLGPARVRRVQRISGQRPRERRDSAELGGLGRRARPVGAELAIAARGLGVPVALGVEHDNLALDRAAPEGLELGKGRDNHRGCGDGRRRARHANGTAGGRKFRHRTRTPYPRLRRGRRHGRDRIAERQDRHLLHMRFFFFFFFVNIFTSVNLEVPSFHQNNTYPPTLT
jgi:hypothetical protein